MGKRPQVPETSLFPQRILYRKILNQRRIQCPVNPFVPNAPFLYLLKISKNLTVFWCFQGVEKGCIGNKWVKGALSKIVKDWKPLTIFTCLTEFWIRLQEYVLLGRFCVTKKTTFTVLWLKWVPQYRSTIVLETSFIRKMLESSDSRYSSIYMLENMRYHNFICSGPISLEIVNFAPI